MQVSSVLDLFHSFFLIDRYNFFGICEDTGGFQISLNTNGQMPGRAVENHPRTCVDESAAEIISKVYLWDSIGHHEQTAKNLGIYRLAKSILQTVN